MTQFRRITPARLWLPATNTVVNGPAPGEWAVLRSSFRSQRDTFYLFSCRELALEFYWTTLVKHPHLPVPIMGQENPVIAFETDTSDRPLFVLGIIAPEAISRFIDPTDRSPVTHAEQILHNDTSYHGF